MQRSVNNLIGFNIHATDGNLGSVEEFYFDDHSWIVRYMVVDTRVWLSGRKVLISPVAMRAPDWDLRLFPVKLTREQVRTSPGIETDMPISRQHEVHLHKHYTWPYYWDDAAPNIGYYGNHGTTALPSVVIEEIKNNENARSEENTGDPRLGSTCKMEGFRIHATDHEIGPVVDFIMDDTTWKLLFVVADTRKWLGSQNVLIPSQWISKVNWEDSQVVLNRSRESIKSSAAFDPTRPVILDHEDHAR